MSYATLSDIVRRELEALVVTRVGPVGSDTPIGQRMISVAGSEWTGTLGDPHLDATARRAAEGCDETSLLSVEHDGAAVEIFVERFRPPPKLVIVGAVHVAIHLVHFAKRLGFRCVVVDARSAFATAERFPHADELHVQWPSQVLEGMPVHGETYCVFLTHDPKLDDPALCVALRRGAGYVGALGSKKTHAKRKESLRQLGLADELISRIHAPIGLDLGGRKPEEIALSIAAEILASRYGRETLP